MFLITLILSAISWNISLHDVPIATFRIYQESDQILMGMSMDAEDLAVDMNLASSAVLKKDIQRYLNNHTSFIFNKERHHLKITSLEKIGDHFKLKAAFQSGINDIKSLKITNTCLLKVENQSNIIQIDINGTTRDFRMHTERKSIEVNY